MAKLEQYLKDRDGNPSSTRLISWILMWFFMVFNILICVGFVFGEFKLEFNNMLWLLCFDIFLLLAIFVPKQLNKVQEIKAIIETFGKYSEKK